VVEKNPPSLKKVLIKTFIEIDPVVSEMFALIQIYKFFNFIILVYVNLLNSYVQNKKYVKLM